MIAPVVAPVRVGRDRTGTALGDPRPQISWHVASAPDGWHASRAELRLTREGGVELVDVDPEAGLDLAWPFAPLAPRERIRIQARVHGDDGSPSPWSAGGERWAAFLGEGEWRAAFIDAGAGPARLRTRLRLNAPPRRATLYATAHGVLTAELNGRRVSDDVLAPGWTAYRHRLIHESWDVTGLLEPGETELALTVADGWYGESYGFGDEHARAYDGPPAVAAQLHLEHADGTIEWIATGPGWEGSADGPLRASGIYAGEEYDARREWRDWRPARVAAAAGPVPEARTGPPVVRHELVPVREVLTTPSGRTVLDFGRNLVGRVRLVSRGRPGDEIELRHAEVLEAGELASRPLRRARALDRYVHGGEGPEVWEPEHTFHGFRYVQLEAGGAIDPTEVQAVVVHSRMAPTAAFRCSEPLVERLHENVVQSMRGNFLALPTDCPQRDERLGWTGDVQVFAATASALFDCDAFLASWLRDLALEQADAGGVVPVVVPWVLGWEPVEVAGWGDAATVVPSVLHERFADASTLRTALGSMRAWADRLLARADGTGLIEGGFQFGDWLDPTAPPEHPELAATHPDLVASAWFVRTLDLVASAARELGEDPEPYADAAGHARAAFRARHLQPDGRLSSDAPTAYALAIGFGVLESDERTRAGERLAELVGEAGHRIATGFLGTPLLLDALCDTGHADDAVGLLLQRECPSWLYPVTMGATTVWERWDSMRPDGSINPGEMTSFNHYALGAVADWLHRRLAGLTPVAPGYRRIRVEPLVTSRLDGAEVALETPLGSAAAGWRRDASGRVTVSCRIPVGASAEVVLPDGRALIVESGVHTWRC